MNPIKKLFLPVVLLIALSACGGNLASPAARLLHRHFSKPSYVSAEVFKASQFPPPPADGSAEQAADIALTMDLQQKRTEADCARARATADADYEYFWGAENPFPTPLPKEVGKFFRRLDYDAGEAVTEIKGRFRRLRPFKAYPEVRPCVKQSAGYSYPSGHSIFSRIFADVLGDIIPSRKAEFLKRADEIAMDRVIGGVHYRTDENAGKDFGDAFHAELRKNLSYLADIEKAKTFLVKR